MTKPALVVVDDEATTMRALEVALLRRFGADYRVLARESPERALRVLERLRLAGEPVAVVIADQWMPTMTGVDLLSRVHGLHPSARRALLVDAMDRSTNEPVSRGMALGWVDSWLVKPWAPAEQLYLRVAELLADWVEATGRPGWRATRVVAEPWTRRAHEMQDLLDRNGIPAEFHGPASAEGQRLLARAERDTSRLPVMLFHDGRVLVDPSNAEVAAALGVPTRPPTDRYDLVVVGAGPAGLSAAVYGASDGLSTLLLDSQAMGGQAGTSARIRNYLGFPRGVSGRQLAVLAAQQAVLLGAQYVFGHATGLEARGMDRVIRLADGSTVVGRAVVVSVGVTYRRLGASGVDDLVGAGVFYGAAVSEAGAVRGQPVVIVGAGNSAGQAAVHLAKYADQVTLVVRGSSLAAAMSDYLVKEIGAARNITIRRHTQVTRADGAGRLESLTLLDTETGRSDTVPAAALFILIGARPHTDWLTDTLALDEHGFILTGRDLASPEPVPTDSPPHRPPLPLESSIPGVFSAGDVRHGSIKRVASAAGEGAVVIRLVHEHLAQPHETPG